MALGFQDFSSSSMYHLFNLHNHIMVVMLSVLVLITYIMIFTFSTSSFYKFLSESTFVETIWSLVPAFLLVILVVPSMSILYLMEDLTESPYFTFKIIAHQWYWSYVMPITEGVCYFILGSKVMGYEFDSMLESSENTPRLLGATDSLVLPCKAPSRLLITSMDVIHSFAVPSLGLKVDALPGRINQLFSTPKRVGLFFGQCSEICGSNHSFMPISLKVMPYSDYSVLAKTLLLDASADAVSV